jgi:probable HAF family extracellular repeat protein
MGGIPPVPHLVRFLCRDARAACLAAFALTCLAARTASGQVQDNFRLHWINVPPSLSAGIAFPTDISDGGIVVGIVGLTAPTGEGIARGFVWERGLARELIVRPDLPSTVAVAVNSSGRIVANAADVLGGQYHVFDVTGPQAVPIPTGGTTVESLGLTNAGHVYGSTTTVLPQNGITVTRGFIFKDGALTVLGTLGGNWGVVYGMNDLGDAVGVAALPDPNFDFGNGGDRAVIYRAGEVINLGVLPGDTRSWAYAINNKGDVVGNSAPMFFGGPYPTPRVFLFRDGQMRDIGALPGASRVMVWSRSINDAGMVVGLCEIGTAVPFLWTEATGMVDLRYRISPVTPANGFPQTHALNNRGQMVGMPYIATPELNWKGDANGGGEWDAPGAWSWNLKPAEPHPVAVDNFGEGPAVLLGPAAATTVAELRVGTNGPAPVELALRPGVTLTVSNDGQPWADGRLVVGGSGRVAVASGAGLSLPVGATVGEGGELVAAGTFAAAGVDNAGVFAALPGSDTVVTGVFRNSGVLRLDGAAPRFGGFDQTDSGVTVLSGGVLIGADPAAPVAVPAGRLTGSGTVAGGLDLQPPAVLAVRLAGTEPVTGHDVVTVGGPVDLAGSLEVAVDDSFTPSPPDVFAVLVASGPLSGAFANVASGDRVFVQGKPWSFRVDCESLEGGGSLVTLSRFQVEYGLAGSLEGVRPVLPVSRYRLYSPALRSHLYTTDANEYAYLPAVGWVPDGPVHRIFPDATSSGGIATVPIRRFYIPATQEHLYTTDDNEYRTLSAAPSFRYEGVDGHMFPPGPQPTGTLPLFRLFNPFTLKHLLTSDANEYAALPATGFWVAEGVVGYVVPNP